MVGPLRRSRRQPATVRGRSEGATLTGMAHSPGVIPLGIASGAILLRPRIPSDHPRWLTHERPRRSARRDEARTGHRY